MIGLKNNPKSFNPINPSSDKILERYCGGSIRLYVLMYNYLASAEELRLIQQGVFCNYGFQFY